MCHAVTLGIVLEAKDDEDQMKCIQISRGKLIKKRAWTLIHENTPVYLINITILIYRSWLLRSYVTFTKLPTNIQLQIIQYNSIVYLSQLHLIFLEWSSEIFPLFIFTLNMYKYIQNYMMDNDGCKPILLWAKLRYFKKWYNFW